MTGAAGGPRSVRRLPTAFLAFATALVLRPGLLRAQDPQHRPEAPGRMEITAGNALSWQDEETTVTYFNGQVVIRRSDLEMSAARALVWQRKKPPGERDPAEKPAPSFDEIYLEGNVLLRRGKQMLRAERLFFDLVHDKAAIIELRMKSGGEGPSAKGKPSFYISAREARQVAAGRFMGTDVSMTTCSYGVPHYHFSVEHAILQGEGPRTKEGPWDFFPYESWTLKLEDVYPELMGAPIFFLPAMILSPIFKDVPLRRLQFGHSSRFGEFVYSDWGTKIKKVDETGRTRVWGDLDVEVDWRQERGWGFGPRLDYAWAGYRGYIDAYYLHDLGRDPDLGFNAKFGPLEQADRGRLRFYHRQDLDEHWRIELKAHYLSDRDLLEEFFTKEFQESEEPETSAYLRYVDGAYGGFLEGRFRINDFQTQNEYLPRVNLSALQLPLVRGQWNDLYVTERFDASHIRRLFDDDLNLPSEELWRIDSYTELSLPFDFRWFQVFPFASQRLTYYDRDLAGEQELRSLSAAGVGVSTQAHGTFPDIAWEWIGLRGVRHILELEARWTRTLDHSVPPSELRTFDPIDQLTEMEEVYLGFRQRFKTKDSAGKPFEFLFLGVGVEYYPRAERDTATANSTNYELPFEYISLVPDTTGVFQPRHWSNVHYEGTFTPRNFLSASGYGEYNPQTGKEEFRQFGITFIPAPQVRLIVAETFVPNVTNAYSAALYASLTPKWAVRIEGSYDFHVAEYLRQEVVVSRDFHDFMIEAVAEHDFSTRDRRFYVTFVPKFLGGKSLHRSHIYGVTGIPPPPSTDP